jgi:hypothetical protein
MTLGSAHGSGRIRADDVCDVVVISELGLVQAFAAYSPEADQLIARIVVEILVGRCSPAFELGLGNV